QRTIAEAALHGDGQPGGLRPGGSVEHLDGDDPGLTQSVKKLVGADGAERERSGQRFERQRLDAEALESLQRHAVVAEARREVERAGQLAVAPGRRKLRGREGRVVAKSVGAAGLVGTPEGER